MKICSKCGTEYLDNARFCEKCGLPLIEKQEEQPVIAEKGKPKKNTVVGVVTILLLIGALTAGILMYIRSNQGYRKTVEQLQSYLNDREVDYWKYEKLVASDFEIEADKKCTELLLSSGIETWGWGVDYDFDNWEDHYGYDWKIKVKILDVAPMSKSTLEQANEEIEKKVKSAQSEAKDILEDQKYCGYYVYPEDADYLAGIYKDKANEYKKSKITNGKVLTLQYKVSGKSGCTIYAESIAMYLVDDNWIFMKYPDIMDEIFW